MTSSIPIPFITAIDFARSKGLLPVTEDTGTAELSTIAPEIRTRAVFSARTRHASHLAEIQRMTDKLLGPPADPLQRVSKQDARQELRRSLADLGYDPAQVDARPGSLKDLGSARRLNLILDHNVREARGYGRRKEGNTSARLRAFPAQEFTRVYAREEPRTDWPARWRAAGGELYEGRMIAPKDSSVWRNLSRFGTPWPPFDFGSGMGLRDISRREALRLGVIQPGTQVQPDRDLGLNDEAEISFPETTGALQEAIKDQLGNAVQIIGGVLRLSSTNA